MKFRALLSLLILIAAIIFAGCTGQPPAVSPATPAITGAVVVVPVTSPSSSVPPELAGNWTLTRMGIQRGTAVVTPVNEFPIRFFPDGTLSGYDGCNNYYATVHLTGVTTPHGSGMTLGPVGRSEKYCASLNDQEQQYFHILEQTSAYDIDTAQLTLTASTGDVLIYQRPSSL